jgi:hypothetical protein
MIKVSSNFLYDVYTLSSCNCETIVCCVPKVLSSSFQSRTDAALLSPIHTPSTSGGCRSSKGRSAIGHLRKRHPIGLIRVMVISVQCLQDGLDALVELRLWPTNEKAAALAATAAVEVVVGQKG